MLREGSWDTASSGPQGSGRPTHFLEGNRGSLETRPLGRAFSSFIKNVFFRVFEDFVCFHATTWLLRRVPWDWLQGGHGNDADPVVRGDVIGLSPCLWAEGAQSSLLSAGGEVSCPWPW